MAPVQIWAMGLAIPLPAMSGAEACTGSNIDGYAFAGLMSPPGAMPIEPAMAGPRSERMSPKRFEATTTSNQSGCCTKWAVRMSMWYCEVLMPGYCAEIALKRSSQYGMVIEMPLDLVADVTWFFARVFAVSQAKGLSRSQPRLVKTESWVANSCSVPACMMPPAFEYSPSLFSRTTQKSMWPAFGCA